MDNNNYSKSGNSVLPRVSLNRQAYEKLIKGISPKIKDIFDRRFGVKTGLPETLESIGERLKITRERVRQIEEAGFKFVRKNNKETLDNIFSEFAYYFENNGGFKREDIALADLGGSEKNKSYVLFLLTIGKDRFSKIFGKKDYHYFWSIASPSGEKVKETLDSLVSDIKSHGKILDKNEIFSKFAPKYNLSNQSLASYLEISKKIQENKEGKIGLVDWPEVKPRGVKDKAFLVFKKEQKPLHFRKITELIDGLEYNLGDRKAHPQTVHNELIKDSRFVLVGRGTYALKEWGYYPGTIKDVIAKILKEKQEGILQDDIVKEVLAQRLVAKNTVLINLNNKKHFNRNSEGRYFLNGFKEA